MAGFSNVTRNPALWRGALGAVVAAAASVGLLSTTVVATANGYLDALLTVVVAAIPLISAALSHGKVSPVSSEVRAGEPVLVLDHATGQYVPDPAGRLDHDSDLDEGYDAGGHARLIP